MTAEAFDRATFSGAGLACRRGGRTVFAALDFTIASGDGLVLRGANGSGKTTLLRVMAGLATTTAGDLNWSDTAVADDPEAHGARTRFIGHLDGIKPALTVTENLSFWARLWHGDGAIPAALAAFGLQALGDLPARVLSAGQRHRLALARLLIAPAPLWLLDEPGNALDDGALAALAAVIARHRQRGGMVVLAGHGAVPMGDAKTLDVTRFAAGVDPHWSDAA